MAQTSPGAVTGWQKLRALPLQTKVRVKADHRKATCRITAVTEDELTCAQIAFPRAEVQTVKVARTGTSTVAGLLIGAGAGAGVGAGIGSAVNSGDTGSLLHVSGGKAAGVGAGLGAAIGIIAGGLIGYGTDIFATTLYKR